VLGLGDQGIGGMGISIGKLSLYTACGGISPAYTLPVALDVGTDNRELLADPMYMGERHERIRGEDYDAFVDQVMEAFARRWPDALVQFEDFAQPNAMPILRRWQDRACCFNDDIQGTAAVTLGTLLAASALIGQRLSELRVAIVGAGSAGCGIAEQIVRRMVADGAPEADARARIFMVDRLGLVTASQPSLRDFQVPLAQPDAVHESWRIEGAYPSLLEVIREARPAVLIGVSAQAGLFTEEVVKAMRAAHARPIIFPLSNPSRHVEATPEQVLTWTGGDAIVATGSPFPPVQLDGREHPIAQCNNAYIFPGIGLGVISARARRVDEAMMTAAATALAHASPAVRGSGRALLPPLTELANLSREIAFAVGKAAQAGGHAAEIPDEQLRERIEANFWQPRYREYRRVSV
jgi:malate dehydrogenase (oxaloacetate-decarboxylating)